VVLFNFSVYEPIKITPSLEGVIFRIVP